MSTITLLPSASRLLARADIEPAQRYGQFSDALGGLYPIPMAAYQMDDYRMMAGWPVPVPKYDVSADTLLSCTGDVIVYREAPSLADTTSMMRWIADEDQTYVSNQWFAYNGSFDSQWLTSDGFAPVPVSDYEYRIGSERLYANLLNFDSDSQQHMWADLTPVIGGAASYSVIMVVNLHSVFMDTDKPIAGIWCPGLPTPFSGIFTESIDNFMSVTLRAETLYLETEQVPPTKGMPIADLLANSKPSYFAFTFGHPYSTIYAGAGPSSMRRVSIYTGSNQVPLNGNVVLGRDNGSTDHCADMSLLDLGIYPGRISTANVNAEIAKLSAVYGGDI